MGDVIGFPLAPGDLKLTKKRLALVIHRTPRWIEMRMRDDGFPHHRKGHRVFFWLSEVVAWWQVHESEPFDLSPLTPPPPSKPAPDPAPEPRRVEVGELQALANVCVANAQSEAYALLKLVGPDDDYRRALVDRGLELVASALRVPDPSQPGPSDAA